MADILFVTMETGGLADKSSIYFLLSKTHSILLAEEITRFAEIKKLSYLPVMCGLNLSNGQFSPVYNSFSQYFPLPCAGFPGKNPTLVKRNAVFILLLIAFHI